MAERRPIHATVLETGWLTPRMVRLVVGGEELRGFGAGAFTDHYVKLVFGRPEPEARPRVRSFTVRAWDPERLRLTIDFVHHGDVGIAGPWAASARPGDPVTLLGPGGGYAPDPDADWHLMVGDESVLPAIAASLPRIPAGVPVHVLVEVADAADELPLTTPGDLRLRWLRRGDRSMADAVGELAFPPGAVHAFVHGEAGMVRAVRRRLLVDRGIPPEALSCSGYWKRSRSDEDWRAEKPEWKRLVEADSAAVTS